MYIHTDNNMDAQSNLLRSFRAKKFMLLELEISQLVRNNLRILDKLTCAESLAAVSLGPILPSASLEMSSS